MTLLDKLCVKPKNPKPMVATEFCIYFKGHDGNCSWDDSRQIRSEKLKQEDAFWIFTKLFSNQFGNNCACFCEDPEIGNPIWQPCPMNLCERPDHNHNDDIERWEGEGGQ